MLPYASCIWYVLIEDVESRSLPIIYVEKAPEMSRYLLFFGRLIASCVALIDFLYLSFSRMMFLRMYGDFGRIEKSLVLFEPISNVLFIEYCDSAAFRWLLIALPMMPPPMLVWLIRREFWV